MSKKEKLSAFLEAFSNYFNGGAAPELSVAIDAFGRYASTPDDQPQPPEMPECVLYLVKLAEGSLVSADRDAAARIRYHYGKPLKLEAGKCYEDAGGNVVDIVWYDPTFADHFVGVLRLTGDPKRYTKGGVCIGGTDFEKIIREVNR